MLQKVKGKLKQMTIKKAIAIIIGIIPAVIFLVFIYYMMIRSFTGTVKDTVTDTDLSFSGLETLSDSFEDVLEENIYRKLQVQVEHFR